MRDSQISRHEHERGAPLLADCDRWCEAKYLGWIKRNKMSENKLKNLTKKEVPGKEEP